MLALTVFACWVSTDINMNMSRWPTIIFIVHFLAQSRAVQCINTFQEFVSIPSMKLNTIKKHN